MIAKNELTQTLEAVREVAAAQGVDPGTILQCALLGVLDEINQAIGGIPATVHEGHQLARRYMNIALACAGLTSQKDSPPYDEQEPAACDLLEDLRALQTELAQQGKVQVEVSDSLRALKRIVHSHEGKLDTHGDCLQAHDSRLDKAGEALQSLNGLLESHLNNHPGESRED